jgi:hypothetical protein
MKIKMTDLDTLQDFHAAINYVGNLGDLRKDPSMPEHWKPIAEWRTSAKEVILELCILFYPHLGQRRREKVKEFLTWYKV